MPENIKITLQPAPVQQISLKTGPTTIIQGGGSANAFGVVNVAGQNNIFATSNSDTLQVVAGSGISLTNDPPNNALTISATGGSAIDQLARDTANGSFLKANTANVTGESAFAKANAANLLAQGAFLQANLAFDRANTFANASNITSGTLAVARGGTGQSSYTNGELLIGNTISGGLDKANLTAGGYYHHER
jgi:hypothetical protein